MFIHVVMKIINDFFAAITFFTRIPVWKFLDIPAENYKRMIYFWPLVGWITSGITVLAWYAFSPIFPPIVAIVLSFAVRVILTGGFHEDGLGDFFDGFGGGRTKDDVLRIMKDSHAGSYSVLGLILYYMILISIFHSMPSSIMPVMIFAGDPLSKFATTIMMNILPYARPEAESKSKMTYNKLTAAKMGVSFLAGVFPMFCFLDKIYWLAGIFPLITMVVILLIAKKKIQGYTGDVCGASALLCELSFYLGILALLRS